MKYINLIDKLSAEDKETIKKYICKYEIREQDFVGVDTWLQSWSHANQKLYKLLGNQFIYKVPFEYIKAQDDIDRELKKLVYHHPFMIDLQNFRTSYKTKGFLPTDILNLIFYLTDDINIYKNNKVGYAVKYRAEGAKKLLQISMEEKPLKALKKIVDYFELNKDNYEDFRIAHSIIFNDKVVNGNLCISIHPMDFMTMSDNDSNWSSCMSWEDKGCYHAGTVEMMNSNNVLCCYIESKTPYKFAEGGVWNNKKWRVLAYITKDIVMNGKSYPYDSQELNKIVVEKIKDLAAENLGWFYQYGLEEYKDMQYLYSTYAIDRARNYGYHAKIFSKSFHKHNIIWDTKKMYNDMLNDHQRKYYCYRNKVDRTKVISVSGKTNCLCCGDNIPLELKDYDDYNERYYDVDNLFCGNCKPRYYCSSCENINAFLPPQEYQLLNSRGNVVTKRLCGKCIEKYAFVCPECGKAIYHPDTWNFDDKFCFGYYVLNEMPKEKIFINDVNWSNNFDTVKFKGDEGSEWILQPCFCCKECGKEKQKSMKKIEIWRRYYEWRLGSLKEELHGKQYIFDDIITKENASEYINSKYFKENLKRPTPDQMLTQE